MHFNIKGLLKYKALSQIRMCHKLIKCESYIVLFIAVIDLDSHCVTLLKLLGEVV